MSEKARVFVGLPVYGGYHSQFVPCLARLIQSPPANADLKIAANPGDSLVSRSRNRLAAQFLASDATHLMFIDTDLIFSPEHIARLVSHGKELVVGCYPKKQAKLAWVLNTLEEFGKADPVTGLQRILYGGTGFMLIARRAFEKVATMFPELQYDPDDGEPEGLYHDFFRVGVCVANGRRRYLSEDWYFCEMARQAGVECFADTRVVLRHCGEAVYPLADPFQSGEEGAEGGEEEPGDQSAVTSGQPEQPKACGPEAPRSREGRSREGRSRAKKLRTTKHRDTRRPAR